MLASPIQHTYWKQLNNNSQKSFDVATISAVFDGTLQAQDIKVCLQKLLYGVEILRTHYHLDELGALWQNISSEVAVNFIELNWQHLDEIQIAEQKNNITNELKSCGSSTPWHRVVLADMGDTCWLYLELSGINTDAFSLNYLLDLLLSAGNGNLKQSLERLHEDIIQYAELAPWLADFLLDDDLLDARAFWTKDKSIAGLQQPFSLQRYMHASTIESSTRQYSFASVELGDVFDHLDSYASQHQATVAEVICASLRLSLTKYSKEASLARVFDSRGDSTLAEAIGPLSRAVPLFPDVSDSFDIAVENERDCSALAIDYSECFAKEHAHENDGFTFIFDSIDRPSGSAATIEQVAYFPEAFKLQFMLITQGNATRLQLTYDSDFIDEQALNYFLTSCKSNLVDHIQGNKISPPPSYKAMGKQVTTGNDVTVLKSFERALNIPDAAVTQVGGDMASLSDINASANRLAHYLIGTGIGKGDAIALCLTRSIEFVIAMLAVMKTGAAYIPIDVELPVQRINTMLQDAQAKAFICQGDFSIEGCQAIDYSALELGRYDITTPDITIGSDDLAYILFTSGSTGKAKGVSISHKALLNHMNWINQEFSFKPQDRFLQRTSASFDASIWEFWSPLLVGGTMVIAPSEINYEPSLFRRIVSEQHITRMQIVPSLLEVMTEDSFDGYEHNLQTIFCGGEALKMLTARRAQSVFNCEIVNLYGPSECCIDATFWRFNERLITDFVPIGYPVNNLSCRVVKENGTEAAKGESGELQIAGDSLFNGYYHQADLTDEAMHYCEASQINYYKTGDHVRVLADNNLMYLERLDDQVKLNGFRIEPDEITMLVLNAGLAEQAKCIFSASSHNLSLFIIEAKASATEIMQMLKSVLPEYMVPHQLIEVETFPYLSNGKLNKRALADWAMEHSSAGYVAPGTEIESKLVVMWQELLNISMSIGTTHDFFAIGGHSLLAMKVVNRITEEFDITISVRVLFEHKTIAELAAYIEPLTLLADVVESEDDEMEGGLL
ncbi:non-ribosomal peptide synthetase [Colwellia psychrerythraea]|uniref:non-ribosomal peptide synthetase n=1 Tax=Colwellia psychrerythraea TaxID=28229 RepID=UPI001E6154F9|nr:non-ribosomal peptide synthetase [Colwellia psychrerythraea]